MTRSAPFKKSELKAAAKPAPNQAKPPQPVTKRDTLDVDRADAEGMAQPQGNAARPTGGKTARAQSKGKARK